MKCKFIYPLYMTHIVRSDYLCLHWEKYSAYLAFTFRFLLFGFCSFSGAASNSSKRSSCGTVDFEDEDFVSLCVSSSLSRNISSFIGWNLQAIDLQNKIFNSPSEKGISSFTSVHYIVNMLTVIYNTNKNSIAYIYNNHHHQVFITFMQPPRCPRPPARCPPPPRSWPRTCRRRDRRGPPR